MMTPNNALERTAAPLLHSTVASIRKRLVHSSVTVGGGRSALIRYDNANALLSA
jgi:hypothetical protein